jgi:hypothetical protein
MDKVRDRIEWLLGRSLSRDNWSDYDRGEFNALWMVYELYDNPKNREELIEHYDN